MYRSIILLILGVWASDAYQQRSPQTAMKTSSSSLENTRRSTILAFPAFAMIAGTFTASSPSLALDMDSFMAKELDSTKVAPKMSDDEALCKFGAPSKGTGNACLRAGLPTKRSTGVDAFGTVDRGTFVRCKPNYVDDPKNKGMLINIWDCQ
eukprot:CAMPEP_0168175370 /NCGR_PEP_ID=MMETSP0139_2-20121125/7084_1 /TAXON_ID=44445 /ORGANISM="Pseudo-nitzschia australis, Strain 10249 10 AB" /LENGTH=151 /DNA_ID=CAMNT_0008093749 /DNA_START=134 /DNA_END=589 /DNA_ORIENTATION=+